MYEKKLSKAVGRLVTTSRTLLDAILRYTQNVKVVFQTDNMIVTVKLELIMWREKA